MSRLEAFFGDFSNQPTGQTSINAWQFADSSIEHGWVFTTQADAGKVTSTKFFIRPGTDPGPNGSMRSKIYTISGTLGIDAKPGTLLATSALILQSAMTGIFQGVFGLEEFLFTGAQSVQLASETALFVTIEAVNHTIGNIHSGQFGQSTEGNTGFARRLRDTPAWAFAAAFNDTGYEVYTDAEPVSAGGGGGVIAVTELTDITSII